VVQKSCGGRGKDKPPPPMSGHTFLETRFFVKSEAEAKKRKKKKKAKKKTENLPSLPFFLFYFPSHSHATGETQNFASLEYVSRHQPTSPSSTVRQLSQNWFCGLGGSGRYSALPNACAGQRCGSRIAWRVTRRSSIRNPHRWLLAFSALPAA